MNLLFCLHWNLVERDVIYERTLITLVDIFEKTFYVRLQAVNCIFIESIIQPLEQCCPTHSPLATCGEWSFICGEWLSF